jgi:heat shock protein HslJ
MLAVGIAGAAAACLPIDLTRLDGTHWRAVLVVNIVPAPGEAPVIAFNAPAISGTVGCETFQAGKVTIDPPRLKIEDLVVGGQMPPCGDRQSQLMETAFFNALTRAEFIEVDGGRLVLKGAQGALVFEQIPGSG